MSLRKAIQEALKARGPDKTICPSEVLPPEEKQNPERMREVREVASELVAEGLIEATAKGVRVDPRSHRGPLRLRLKPTD